MDWKALQNLPGNQAAENNKTVIWQKFQVLGLTINPAGIYAGLIAVQGCTAAGR